MSGPDETTQGPGHGAEGDREPVGSVGEEAAKLFGALSGWARDQGGEAAGGAAGLGESVAQALRGVDEHLATGGEDCRYCPVCQVIHAVRSTSPEVRAHLASAAGSLAQAAAGFLATRVPGEQGAGGTRAAGVEKIDLDDAGWDDTQ